MIPVNGLHIEPTNICTLKCPGCARTRFLDQWPQHWQNHNLNLDNLFNFLDIDLTDKKILICGNYGDPIYYRDLIPMVAELKKKNAELTIVTNGSYKTQEWWESLVDLLSFNDTIQFSIDGTPDNFTEYRINADWKSILTGINTAVKAKCRTEWKYIPFAYNQNDISTARELSQSLGIDGFLLYLSDRFDDKTQGYKPEDKFLANRYELQNEWKQTLQPHGITPKCSKGKEHYISAAGFYSSCCYITDHRFYYKTMWGQKKTKFNIAETTLSKILTQPKTVEFYQNLNSVPACQYNCPSIE